MGQGLTYQTGIASEALAEMMCGTSSCGFQRLHSLHTVSDHPGNSLASSQNANDIQQSSADRDEERKGSGTRASTEKHSLSNEREETNDAPCDGQWPTVVDVEDYIPLSACASIMVPEEDISEDEVDEVQRVPAWRLNRRRGAVSAEASGAFNVRYANCTAPVNEDISDEHMLLLVQCLGSCPFMRGENQQTLKSVARAMAIEKYLQGDIIVTEGEVGRSGYVLLSGTLDVLTPQKKDSLVSAGSPKRSSQRVHFEIHAGSFFGENTMLWGLRRQRTIKAKSPVMLGKLKRNDFFNLTTHQAMTWRNFRQESLRKCRMFECLSDEQIAQLVDGLEEHTFYQGDVIIKQGGSDRDLYIVVSGECEASRHEGNDDDQVHRHYRAGDRFGELGFQTGELRGASIFVTSPKATVLRLGVRRAERMVGKLKVLEQEQYLSDPRKTIADFFRPNSDATGTAGACYGGRAAKWFAVYRPTSREAIAKMLDRTAVGKGLNVKGKSAKKNILSGFVPFLQISENSDKCKVEDSPKFARIRVFFQSSWARDCALNSLKPWEDPSKGLNVPSEPSKPGECVGVALDDRFGHLGIFGLDVPEIVLRKVYIDDQDISTRAGWETGRQSEPAFMDMNLHAVRERNPTMTETVLYQFDQSNPLNPHGLLIAYAEESVKPVVSDFDTFTVGSHGGAVKYEELVPEQQALAAWSLDKTAGVLASGCREGWNCQWLQVLKSESAHGFHPVLPRFGFGDATSYELVSSIVDATKDMGAIRHGAECFNFMFPQELDAEYLVVWEGFPDKPWAYKNEAELREFMKTMVVEGYVFPINPVWAVRDPGWYEIYTLLKENHSREMAAWMPPASGIADKIEAIRVRHPDGFQPLAVPPTLVKASANSQVDSEAAPGDEAAGEGISEQLVASQKAADEEMYYPDHDREDLASRARTILSIRRWRAAKDLVVASRRLHNGMLAKKSQLVSQSDELTF